jgi:CubicO group peptidase (beta-lactamase class C family)
MKKFYTLLIAIAVSSCGGSGSSSAPVNPPAPTPAPAPDSSTYPGSSWETSDPSDVDMSQAGILEALNYAFESSRNTQGVVIIRHGVIVGERYANGKSKDSLATSWSTGKSFASALVGIAKEQGFIDSIDLPAENYLAAWANSDKSEITIRAILEMRTGLAPASRGDSNIYTFGGDNGDQLAYALNRSPRTTPRTDNWAYQNTDSMLLAGILEESTGQNVRDYADIQLFSKIGMTADWWTDEAGHAMTYCCIDTTTRDFARFGLLFARNGRWDGEQVVPADWVAESIAVPSGTSNQYYALQWWVSPSGGYFYSAGLHTNNIYIFPDLDLVVVRNSLYSKIGDSSIRSGSNYHSTLEPGDWNNTEFLSYITNAITN